MTTTRRRTDLPDLARQNLGEHAERLLEAGAIVPVVGKRPTAKWSKPIDPYRPYDFDGLALKTGDVSGITVIDFDAEEPWYGNVQTKRGGHVWVPATADDKSRPVRGRHIDIKGNKGIALWHSAYHRVLHLDLQPRTEFLDLLTSPTSIPGDGGCGYHVTSTTTRQEYKQKLHAAGYVIDLDSTQQKLVSQVVSASQGHRNETLYKNLCATYLIGGDLQLVIDAAARCGLEQDEVQRTVQSALTDPQGIDVFDLAHEWLAAAQSALHSPVAAVLARNAIEQHTLRPLLNQVRAVKQLPITRMTMQRHLKKYIEAGLLKKHRQRGTQRNGNLWPNNYQLLVHAPEQATSQQHAV